MLGLQRTTHPYLHIYTKNPSILTHRLSSHYYHSPPFNDINGYHFSSASYILLNPIHE